MASSLLTYAPFYLSLTSTSARRNSICFAVAPFASISTRQRKSRRKKKQDLESVDNGYTDFPNGIYTPSSGEKTMRLAFMEELMERARKGNVSGVSDIIYDMIAAGMTPGPRSYHGLVVANVLNRDEEGAMHALKRELGEGLRPLHETFIALVRLFGSNGHATRGFEILGAMETLNYDIRQAWILLVEELLKNSHLEDANKVFLKGAKSGLRASDELYDRIIEEDCKVGDHSNALTIAYEMEAAGRMATTFHFNCLLSVQATCGIPEVAFATFENMEYGEADMKPDTETYNWVIQAYTRAEAYDRIRDVAELVGMMVENHKRLQPNVRTYALLVECFTKYCVIREAIRHFRALKNFEGGTKILHNEGQHGDPLSLYLRALCREGRVVELLDALETMAKDNQQIPPRAMILTRKYRSLVSSWIEPLNEEAELGHEVDYIARYIAEGGLTGERKRWVPRPGKTPLDPDVEGFIFSNPMESSFKKRCHEEWRVHHLKLLRTIWNEGPAVLGNVSESDYIKVVDALKKMIRRPDPKTLKPKAASKMVVSELKEELEAQGLPVDGTRNVLYQRVQKARRINRSRSRPLWIPPVEEEEEEVDKELDELLSRITLHEGDTEFWRRRFLGEGFTENQSKPLEVKDNDVLDATDDGDADVGDDDDEDSDDGDDVAKEAGDDEAGLEEGEAEAEAEPEQPENQVVAKSKDKEVDPTNPLQMIGLQLLEDSDHSSSSSKKSKKKSKRVSVEDDSDEDWFPLDIHEAFKEMRARGVFDAKDMYTLADAWGWTWEKDYKNKTPRKWSQEWEAELAIKIMTKVIKLGGMPTIGDCAMVLRAAIRAPAPAVFLEILQTTHSLGYTFGMLLYDEIITLCLDLGEVDASIAIVMDLENNGIKVPDEILDRVISSKKEYETNLIDDASQ